MAKRKDDIIADELKRVKTIFDNELNLSISFNEIERRCQSNGVLFIDPSFPPSDQSLYLTNDTTINADLSSECKETDVVWKRPTEFIRGRSFYIFEGEIEPNDIKQGALGENGK